jgi:spore coat protein H
MKLRIALVALLSSAGLLARAGSREDRAAFFSSDKVVRIDITIDDPGMEVLRGTPHPWFDRKVGAGTGPLNLTEKPYVRATVVEDGTITHSDVGVRLRGGMGSWQKVDEKPGLFLNMDRFIKGQRFHGMEKVILHNSHQDPRFMNELLTGEVYRAAGVPASRVVHAVVTLNGRRLGLYYLKEGYDKGFLREHFGNADGYVYQGDTGQDIDSWLELSSGADSDHAPTDQADLKALVAALHEPDLGRRWARVDALLDIDRFMRYTAAGVVLGIVDAYPVIGNNYRIYFDTEQRKLVFFPSGVDRCDFGGRRIEDELGGMVARQLLQTPQGRRRYLDAIEHVLATAYDAPALVKRIDTLRALLAPALQECHPDRVAGWDINFWIRDAIVNRPRQLADQLEQARAAAH